MHAPNSMNKTNIRALIADSFIEMERDGTYLSVMEQSVLDKYDHIDPRDKAFYKKVMDGTTEYRLKIDYILDNFSKTPVDRLKPAIRAIMRMSIYQLIWMDYVPDSAVVNEAVKLTASRGLSGLKGYVNGTLRNISRNKDNIRYPKKNDDMAKYLSIEYSCPEWIVRQFIMEYGVKRAESILASFLQKDRTLSVRLRDMAGLDTRWKSDGVEVYINPHLGFARLLKDAGAVNALAGYKEGGFAVQDTGSMFVAELAEIPPGAVVMDLCAAPGGKSIHVADKLCKLTPKGHVYSYDISETRCERLKDNIARLGLDDMISVHVHDMAVPVSGMLNTADTVIADVPCSGLGVLAHKSDIKYRITNEDIDSLVALQRSIIDNAAGYVKPGGRLIYSTCTINRRENEEQAGYIIDKYGFKDITCEALERSQIVCPAGFLNDTHGAGLQILPDIWISDGFYICVLKKTI